MIWEIETLGWGFVDSWLWHCGHLVNLKNPTITGCGRTRAAQHAINHQPEWVAGKIQWFNVVRTDTSKDCIRTPCKKCLAGARKRGIPIPSFPIRENTEGLSPYVTPVKYEPVGDGTQERGPTELLTQAEYDLMLLRLLAAFETVAGSVVSLIHINPKQITNCIYSNSCEKGLALFNKRRLDSPSTKRAI